MENESHSVLVKSKLSWVIQWGSTVDLPKAEN